MYIRCVCSAGNRGCARQQLRRRVRAYHAAACSQTESGEDLPGRVGRADLAGGSEASAQDHQGRQGGGLR